MKKLLLPILIIFALFSCENSNEPLRVVDIDLNGKEITKLEYEISGISYFLHYKNSTTYNGQTNNSEYNREKNISISSINFSDNIAKIDSNAINIKYSTSGDNPYFSDSYSFSLVFSDNYDKIVTMKQLKFENKLTNSGMASSSSSTMWQGLEFSDLSYNLLDSVIYAELDKDILLYSLNIIHNGYSYSHQYMYGASSSSNYDIELPYVIGDTAFIRIKIFLKD